MTSPAALDERALWLDWRRQGVGASDVAGILGLSPWASPWSVWADKMGLLGDEPANEAMEFGRWAELAIAPWFQDRTGLAVMAAQERRQHPDRPLHRATIDGEVYDHADPDPFGHALGGLEIKTTGFGPAWTEIPAHYQAQAQWQCWVCGWERVWVAVLHGRRLDIHELERDDDDIALLVDAVDRFWGEHVVTGRAPATDGHPATLDALRAVYPTHTPGVSVAIDGLAGVHARWLAAKAAAKAAKAAEADAQAALAVALGDAEEGTIGGARVVSWRTQTRRVIDADALRRRLPRVAARFTVETEGRVMRAHTPKGD